MIFSSSLSIDDRFESSCVLIISFNSFFSQIVGNSFPSILSRINASGAAIGNKRIIKIANKMNNIQGLNDLSQRIPDDNIYLSLERRMKCGVGKCGHCQINNSYVCQEGPVYPYPRVKQLEEAI